MSTRTAIDSPFSTPTDDNDPTPTTSATTTTTSNSFILTTATHNYVSRQAVLQNAKQIELRGRSVIHKNCQLRGDLAWLRLGRYVTLEQGVQLVPPPTPLPTLSRPTLSRQATKTQQPPPQQPPPQQSYIPVTVGSYTHMGAHVYSQAAAIGSYCWIAPHVTLGPRVILKDGVIIQAEGCHIPPDTVIPPFTCIVSYCNPKNNNNNKNNKTATSSSTTTSCTQQPQPPAQHQHLEWIELPPSIVVELQEQALQVYQAFSAATAAAKQKEEKDSLQ